MTGRLLPQMLFETSLQRHTKANVHISTHIIATTINKTGNVRVYVCMSVFVSYVVCGEAYTFGIMHSRFLFHADRFG